MRSQYARECVEQVGPSCVIVVGVGKGVVDYHTGTEACVEKSRFQTAIIEDLS